MNLLAKAGIALALFVLVGCGGNGGDGEQMSSSETKTVMHNGTITEVDAQAQKIMVDVKGGETMEFSFTDSTKVLKSYMEVPFDSLQTDREVGVEVRKEGDKRIPTQVNLLN